MNKPITKKDFDEFVDQLFTERKSDVKAVIFMSYGELKTHADIRGEGVLLTILRNVQLVTSSKGMEYITGIAEKHDVELSVSLQPKFKTFDTPSEFDGNTGGILNFIKNNNPEGGKL